MEGRLRRAREAGANANLILEHLINVRRSYLELSFNFSSLFVRNSKLIVIVAVVRELKCRIFCRTVASKWESISQ